ncbi:MAG: hypothetical protein EBZ41_02780 [Actinobacteria bacterium]|nr:hypothetical protein [Actinomycetota bacterium]
MRDQVRTSYSISSVAMVSKAIGGVAPLGWINEPSITLIDDALNDYQVIWAAAGHPHAVFPTTYQELLEASSAKAARVGN